MTRGFTLIEVLVALSVLSIGVIALLKVQGESAATASAVRERLFAEIIAENVMVETVTSPDPLQPGATGGEAALSGKAWRWTKTITPTGDRAITRIEVAVKPAAGDGVLASLIAFRGDK